jgi:hypothetical protein
MAALECKVAMVISRLVKLGLHLELKFEQKKGTSLVKLVLWQENPRHRQCADRTSFCPSYIFPYQHIQLAGTSQTLHYLNNNISRVKIRVDVSNLFSRAPQIKNLLSHRICR